MSYQVKTRYIGVICTLIVFAIYYMIVMNRYETRSFDDTTLLKFWASAILLLIPVLIAARIVVHILFVIFNYIITKEKHEDREDELDKLIDMKGTRIHMWIFMLGFCSAMGTLVAGYDITVMFKVMLFSMIGSGVIGEIAMIIYYRRGV